MLFILFALSLPPVYSANRTENVFIVVIDGIRNTEAFEAENRFMPMIWDSLRPQGTAYVHFRNRGITVTNAGHSTIVTGVRQLLPNNSGIPSSVRPETPTVGEYYRKAFGVPQNKVAYISGKTTIWRDPVGLYPGWGREVAQNTVIASSADTATYRIANEVIFRDHPSLCYVLFAQVDGIAHGGDTTRYIGAIRTVDTLIFKLWKRIQQDPFYRGRTTLFITSDHGRHDDAHGGWAGHGDYCHGCRHVPFLAIGPEIKTNTLVPLERDQIDIVPTVGYLLGFPTPLAQGSVMTEMLTLVYPQPSNPPAPARVEAQEVNLSRSPGMSHSPAIAQNKHGLFVVYSDRIESGFQIRFTRSTDRGDTWSSPQTLASQAKADYQESAVALAGDSTLFVAYSGFENLSKDTTCVWMLRDIQSTDLGRTWSKPFAIDTLGTVCSRIALAAKRKKIAVTVNHQYNLIQNTSYNGGVTFKRATVNSKITAIEAAGVIFDTTAFVFCRGIDKTKPVSWDMLLNVEPWKSTGLRLTQNPVDAYAYYPAVTAGKTALHLVYSFLADGKGGNHWKIRYMKIDGTARNSLLERDLAGQSAGFRPGIRFSDNGKLVALWSGYANNRWVVTGCHSTDEGRTWSNPYPVTSEQTLIAGTDFTVTGDTLNLVWQDMRTGNWDIYFKKSVLNPFPTGVAELLSGTARFELAQNFPNPFNPETVVPFVLPRAEHVTVVVIDARGRKIATLMDRTLSAGAHRAVFKAGDLPSGLYFFKLTAGRFQQIRKGILVR